MKGSELNRDIHVYRCVLETSEDDIREFATGVGLHVKGLQTIEDPKWSTKSFRITVPASELEVAFSANWPRDVCARRWFSFKQLSS